MNNRIGYIDFLRGLATVFVVMGHVLQFNLYGGAMDTCLHIIYSFHMGFFFMISGCAASLSIEKSSWASFPTFLKKKTIQLFLPFIIWGGIIWPLINGLPINDYPSHFLLLLKQPDQGPWFILYLYVIQIIFYICCAISNSIKRKSSLPLICILSVPLVIALSYLKVLLVGHGYQWISPTWLVLFLLGVMLQRVQLSSKYIPLLVIAATVLFVLIVPYFDLTTGGYTQEIIKMVCSIAFSISLFYIVKNNYNSLPDRYTRVFNYLGTNTLEIYLTHFCIIQICATNWLNVNEINGIPLFIMVFLASVPISYLVVFVSKIVKHIPYTSVLLYGKYK